MFHLVIKKNPKNKQTKKNTAQDFFHHFAILLAKRNKPLNLFFSGLFIVDLLTYFLPTQSQTSRKLKPL